MYENILSRKYVDFFCSVFKKIIPDAITSYFQKVGGVSQPKPTYFSMLHKIDFFLQGILTIVFATIFN